MCRVFFCSLSPFVWAGGCVFHLDFMLQAIKETREENPPLEAEVTAE